MRPILLAVALLVVGSSAQAEITRHSGNADPLDDRKYIHVVSEADSPIHQTWIKAKDGLYIAAAIRKPKGSGPFPAIVMFHGAPGGRGMEQLVGWSRGDHGGPVWERFLREGYAVVVADYRGGPWNTMNAPSKDGLTTAIDDGISVIDYVRQLRYVKRAEISVYGVSLGGNLALFLASRVPDLHAVVLGAPAPIWFLGLHKRAWTDDYWKVAPPDAESVRENIPPIRAPILLLVGTEDRLLGVDEVLHAELVKAGKTVRMEVHEHGYHDFVLGNQGHKRDDLPRGEYLMQGALDALESTVKFVRDPRQ
jgi:dienelactone hydrolase